MMKDGQVQTYNVYDLTTDEHDHFAPDPTDDRQSESEDKRE